MPTLAEKVLRLKQDAYLAGRTAMFWEQKIAEHGEIKATEFYRHLGHNHVEIKGFEWEGLILAREPKEHEKIAVKGIHGAQESAKEQIGKILTALRSDLIDEGLEEIQSLEPAEYHTLILSAPQKRTDELKERLLRVFNQGRRLVAAELGKKDAVLNFDDESEELDTLTGITNARIINDVQSRITAAAIRYRAMGLTGSELIKAITAEITGGTVSYIDRASIGLGNKVISMGRGFEAERRSSEWDRVEYSALLDQNVCEPCAAEDGETAESEADLQPAPNPDCAGSDFCRCFHVYINQ